ncbi:MAG: exonuclease SbcCD subunit D [Bacilli bacterium]|nr:exonuclease SbcCD subunit D [Bacilli bacterium]
MKFFHLSDLHLGKRVNEFSMMDDQRYILMEIVRLAKENKPDAILIAGDIYDKSVPPVEAVQLLDRFLVWLNELGISLYIIAGNHDSVERVAFAASLLQKSNVHISQVYSGKMQPLPLQDEFGQINVWLLPHLKPSQVRGYFPDKNIVTYSDAVSAALGNIEIDLSARNVLLAHQFVTGAITSESEELYVGGSENIDGTLFEAFDYVALGHIHRPQYVVRETLRYCGTPLKYSFSEANHSKSITVVELGNKNDVKVSEIPLLPNRELREIRGSYAEITQRKNYIETNTDDYVHITLTDEEDEPEALMKLRTIYPHLMRLDYDNKRTQTTATIEGAVSLDKKLPMELFEELYELQNGQPMNQTQEEYVGSLFAEIWEGSV